MTRPSHRSRIALACAVLAACVQVETFFFGGRPRSEPYRFDEIDPALDGDFSDPHPSLIPVSLREDGFVTTRTGERLYWVMARQPEGAAAATIFFSHGNGPGLGTFWDRVEVLWQLGYQVMIYDYAGYGRSEGDASEPGMFESAETVLAMLASRDDVDPTRLVLYGHSLGGAVTFELAARASRGEIHAASDGRVVRPRAVVTESAWCSIAEMIRDGAFLDLPPELITHLHFDSCARAEALTIPLMLLHGDDDRIVPIRQLGLLVPHVPSPPVVHVAPGASHVDVSVRGTPWSGAAVADGVPRPSADYAAWMLDFAPSE